VEVLSWAFYNAKAFDGDLSNWNTSSVWEMAFVFYGANSFTGKGVAEFDVSYVEDMHGCFYQATKFDANLTLWDTSYTYDMSEMFYGASSFQGVGVSTWDVSGVTLMQDMFGQCYSFNADLSSWDVSGVTNMAQMVRYDVYPCLSFIPLASYTSGENCGSIVCIMQ
jgi:surface protein